MNNDLEQSNEMMVKPSATPLVLGILTFLGLLMPIVGYVLGILGIVFSAKDKKKPNSKYGNIGLILSIIGLVLSVVVNVLSTILLLQAFNF